MVERSVGSPDGGGRWRFRQLAVAGRFRLRFRTNNGWGLLWAHGRGKSVADSGLPDQAQGGEDGEGEDGVLEWLLGDFGDGPAAEEEADGDGGQDDPVKFKRL